MIVLEYLKIVHLVEENTLMFKLYYEDIKREMVETLKDYLKAQIEEIEVC